MPHLTDVQSGFTLASLGGGAVFLVIAAALTGRRTRPAPDAPQYATFTPPPAVVDEPIVWLACHNISCAAHMTTRHIPHDDGTATCQACGQTRLDHQ